MQLKRNEMYKISFFVIDDLITQEKIQKQIFFRGGGGGGGMDDKLSKFSCSC